MKNISKPLIGLFLLVSMLSACGPMYQTSYSYVPPRTERGRMCLNQCIAIKNTCQARYDRQQQQCRRDQDDIARTEFKAYARDRSRKGQPIEKKVHDFYGYNNCSQSNYCLSDYQQCYQNCGGQVIAEQRCVAFCDKAK